jgi:hypothetical protein
MAMLSRPHGTKGAGVAQHPEEVQRIMDAIAALEGIDDDGACIRATTDLLDQWPAQHARLRELRQQRVLSLREQGKTWREIGDLMGVHFTRARQIAAGQRGEKNRPKKAESDPPTTQE